jgi:uncharacterized membrane protein
MKSFDQSDDAFIQMAVDDLHRPELIKITARKRTILFWCAMLITVCALVIIFAETSGKPHGSGVAGVAFAGVAMSWMLVIRCESDLRLLKMVEKLKK